MAKTFDDLCRFVQAEPFRPFTIRVADGSTYRVNDRRSIYVAHDLIVLGRDRGRDGVFERAIDIRPAQITSVTPLKANGSRRQR